MENALQIIVSVAGVGVVFVLALVGTVWRLGSRLGNMEASLESRLEIMDASLESRLGNMEARLETRFERVENRIGDLGAGLRSLN